MINPIEISKDKFFDLLRFLNILEPDGSRVLSISKVFVWVMIFSVVFVLFFHAESIGAVIGASTGAVVAMLNYGLRRVEQRKSAAAENGQRATGS